MTRLKFRAYIAGESRFIYCDDSEENYLGTFFTAIRQIERMSGEKVPVHLSTGLYDSRDQEVYDGDIFQVGDAKMMVCWDDEQAAYFMEELDYNEEVGPRWERLTQNTAGQYGVVGNSCELADLLAR
jgi:hypothetical protein